MVLCVHKYIDACLSRVSSSSEQNTLRNSNTKLIHAICISHNIRLYFMSRQCVPHPVSTDRIFDNTCLLCVIKR